MLQEILYTTIKERLIDEKECCTDSDCNSSHICSVSGFCTPFRPDTCGGTCSYDSDCGDDGCVCENQQCVTL